MQPGLQRRTASGRPPLFVTAAMLFAMINCGQAAFDSTGFQTRARISFSRYTEPEVLANFPVLIKLNAGVSGFSYSQFLSPGGADLRFASEAGDELCYEIDKWDPSGDSYVWVRLPSLSNAGTAIMAYWGKAGLARPPCTTNGATWSEGYLGVWHLNEADAVNSVNRFVGTAHGNVAAPGIVASGQYFSTNPISSWLDLGNLRATNFTIEAWTRRANTTEWGGNNVDDVVFRKQNSFRWYQWNRDWNLNLEVNGGVTHVFEKNGIEDLALPSWSHQAVSYDSATGAGAGYMNGVNKYRMIKGANVPEQNDNTCSIGYGAGGSSFYYGSIDEVRLSSVVRSDAWLQAGYANQLSPESFSDIQVLPALSFATTAAGDLLLSWLGTGPVLQVSPVLGAHADWTTNGIPPAIVNDGISQVTITPGWPAGFFRLALFPGDFQLSAAPGSLSVGQGLTAATVVSVNKLNGFDSSVLFTASGAPSGVTASWSSPSSRTASTLVFDVDGSAAPGTTPITIVGAGGGITRTSTVILTVTATTPGAAYSWPPYLPDLNYDFRQDYPALSAPTNVLNDCSNVVETIASNWWCFRYGPDKNPLVTAAAWNPLLARMNTDFAYFRDVMGWPPDKRAKRGYYSSIYLFGSGLCTDTNSNTDRGGWQGNIHYNNEDWPMVLLSYYPVYSFDPACTYGDRLGQQGACVHEGIHAVLADMPGCRNAAWFHEGGNTWLQGTAEALRTTNYNEMGFLSAAAMVAPFMPIECYSGWLQDDSFGGPSAEGVYQGQIGGTNYCTWRNLLGGNQYGETFPRFMGQFVSRGSIAWVWQNCTSRVLEGLATAPGGLGDSQTRRLIREFRARQAMCDFGPWTNGYRTLLNNNWGANIHAEYPPIWINCPSWTASCYVVTTNSSGTLTPERRTLPGWSGANQIPLKVSSTNLSYGVNFQPLGSNMTCQLLYRATDNSVVYSIPVASGTCLLSKSKPMKTNVVIAVVCNTDYAYLGEFSRTNKFDYRLTFGTGVTNTASITSKWYQ